MKGELKMLDKVEYWLGLCEDDMKAAKSLLESKDFLWMGFICHLIAEKALKAAVANVTSEIPPKTHDLTRLAECSGIFDELSENQLELLETLNPLNIETRYPEHKDRISALMTEQKSTDILNKTEEFLCWIKQKLEK